MYLHLKHGNVSVYFCLIHDHGRLWMILTDFSNKRASQAFTRGIDFKTIPVHIDQRRLPSNGDTGRVISLII